MPPYAAGEFKIVATWDLGGLGPKAGPPTIFIWRRPGILPQFSPWLSLLPLLLLPPNRRALAWWIWLPLGGLTATTLLPESIAGGLPSDAVDAVLDVAGAVAVGLAAVWLLAPYLTRKYRFATSGGVLGILAGFGVVAGAAGQDLGGGLSNSTVQVLLVVALDATVIAGAMFLAGWACRSRTRPLTISLWLLAAIAAVWLAIVTSFLAALGGLRWLASPDGLGLLVIGSCLTFAVLLPFLVLSFLNPLFGERLHGLLHLGVRRIPA
ncbi:MAG: hypothetical protein NTW28_24655 [Candidatus Solibacter sp.]|nr:hypothetical protein [Candidatus Solibacter sp.]